MITVPRRILKGIVFQASIKSQKSPVDKTCKQTNKKRYRKYFFVIVHLWHIGMLALFVPSPAVLTGQSNFTSLVEVIACGSLVAEGNKES